MSLQVPHDDKKHLKLDIQDKENCLQDFLLDDDFDSILCNADWVPQDTLNLSTIQRCVILHVNTSGNTKCIHLQSSKNYSSEKSWCTVSFPWSQLSLQRGDYISIRALYNNNKWIVNATYGIIVTENYSIISKKSLWEYKGSLSEMYKRIDNGSKIMTIKSLVHELYQSCIQNTKVDDEFVRNLWKGIMQKSSTIQMLYRSQLTSEEINGEIDKFVPKIVEVMSKKPVEVMDIEENLWVPSLGLKGKIDVTCKVTLHKRVPLELKVGRPSFSPEHKSQVILYVMMLQELGVDVDKGLLLYLREGVVKDVKPTWNEQRDLIMLRNEKNLHTSQKNIRKYIKDKSGHLTDLPESTYVQPNNFKQISQQALEHLTQKHLDYFFTWCKLLYLENCMDDSGLTARSVEYCELTGICASGLKIEGEVVQHEGSFLHCFGRNKQMHTNFTPGDYVMITTQTHHVDAGFIQSLTPNKIFITLSKNVSVLFESCLFNVDLHTSLQMLTLNSANLATFIDDTEYVGKLRRLIIDLEAPKFDAELSSTTKQKAADTLKHLNTLQQRAVLKVLTTQDYLLIQGMPGTGKTQTVVALIKLLVSLDKTVLITSHTHSAVDNVLVKLHEAGVDFLRLGTSKRINPKIQSKSEECLTSKCTTVEQLVKVYNSAKVVGVTCLGSIHPVLAQKRFDLCIVDESTQVLQCTILRPLFSADKFVLIGDPEQLPPVVRSKDAKALGFDKSLFEQLGASNPDNKVLLTIQYRMNSIITALANKFTYNGLLKCADEQVSSRTITINKSLARDEFSSEKWLYDVISDDLKDSVKFIDTSETWSKYYDDLVDLGLVLKDKNIVNPCVNICEAKIAVCIVNALLKVGITADQIGIISTYRIQVQLIQKLIQQNSTSSSSIEIGTVEQFQGRDKDIIIYSCALSFAHVFMRRPSSREILNDKGRLTAALTRANCKLIMIGDGQTVWNL
ncbi:LOW QUALITY PROTEIN: DNA replication ATP-dependent helicase/nuclease DNA2-like [Ctenocephalides felis]|uniref:LOW QUALITY PROTEIN: DNA replication ATP-dependent helicase/nuclease DNA2-like n=1 Tax=Ctenocephalides felis TaxID=7515 RepID=UPI000E6E4E75|nr:LOW QUALITY PROTEIN: DNA replication ATP-dependent helicase/nuclease DNA2-like [Ctenocephalides felis]